MFIYLLKMFGISLLLTIVVELAVATALKVPITWRNVQLMILVNCLTNPAAVLLNWAVRDATFSGVLDILIQVPIEAVVILVEVKIYRIFAAQPGWNIPKPGRVAVVANAVSWLLGVLLQVL